METIMQAVIAIVFIGVFIVVMSWQEYRMMERLDVIEECLDRIGDELGVIEGEVLLDD